MILSTGLVRESSGSGARTIFHDCQYGLQNRRIPVLSPYGFRLRNDLPLVRQLKAIQHLNVLIAASSFFLQGSRALFVVDRLLEQRSGPLDFRFLRL